VEPARVSNTGMDVRWRAREQVLRSISKIPGSRTVSSVRACLAARRVSTYLILGLPIFPVLLNAELLYFPYVLDSSISGREIG
jgi:hypothetical protein